MPPQTDRIEAAIEKLTAVSADLKAMLAVHEQRITQQEKYSDDLHDVVERRREELDIKLKDVYNTMRDQDKSIVEEIAKLRKESTEQHVILSNKINQLERYMYMAIGGGMVITWLLTNTVHYLKLFH
jgi:chromosome condensin MukBEF ATPase and DNA-binding subunit MukB